MTARGGRPNELADGVADTLITLDVVARRVGVGFHSQRQRHLPRSKTDSGRTTTLVSSASVVAVVTVLCRVGDCFANLLRLVLVRIRPTPRFP